MKLKFKLQHYQTLAVNAVVDCFKGQPKITTNYQIDGGIGNLNLQETGFKNGDIALNSQHILENVQQVQQSQNLPQSQSLTEFKTIKKNTFAIDNSYTKTALKIAPYHFDIEMETGTGKTYCYIKTIFEMNKRFNWSKFIIVVPSIAIREGVYKSLEITAAHFYETYNKKAKFFIYNSKQHNNIRNFSSDAGINIMIINVQAFNSSSKDNLRIYEENENFESCRPIDEIKANRPILILDEPQKMGGTKTLDSLKEFKPLFILRYSATHKSQHNKVHRLDALDAYNQKLVKKITVRGISVTGLAGTHGYLYLESIEISKHTPIARIEIELKQSSGQIKKTIRKLSKGDNLYDISGNLDQYKGLIISDINAINDTVEFSNGQVLKAGEVTGDANEKSLWRIQIRESIKAHFEKEQRLFQQGIKVLTLFFIDEVAKYRSYTDNQERGGEYAIIFEEEYANALNEIKQGAISEDYRKYLDSIVASQTHNGYFSIDKKSKRIIDSKTSMSSEDNVDAYDLILKDKERLLSFEEPTRFIFSHSALREGWDNPNVFVICTLKHSDNTISRRQEVGRGLRIAVNQFGDRQDSAATVHQTNVLTVVTSESYTDFVTALQRDISESLSERPRFATAEYFTGKLMQKDDGSTVAVTKEMADDIVFYLIQNGYVDRNKNITQKYHDDIKNAEIADLPDDFSKELKQHKQQILQLIDSVYSDAKLPEITDERSIKTNPTNDNFNKEEFKQLWNKINHKAVYKVKFNSEELIQNCITELNKSLRVAPLQYIIKSGEQKATITDSQIKSADSFEKEKTKLQSSTNSTDSVVKYDLIGKLVESVKLTRNTVAKILLGLEKSVFDQFKTNPENFISEAIRLIKEQTATCIVEHISYNTISKTYSIDIFTNEQSNQDFSKAGPKLKSHIYDYVITDSKVERNFVQELDSSSDIAVYAKLPRGFYIPTPVGNYNPDWAIAFKKGEVKHIYFVAETKGSISEMELRPIEQTKTDCAKKFFAEINKKAPQQAEKVKYTVIKNFAELNNIFKRSNI